MVWMGPPDGWQPTLSQGKVWNRWINQNCNHLEIIAHRRWGKDEIALFGTMVKATQRVGNYWHMLPLQTQVRKAIWNAVNPRTGKRRIDEAFPESTRANTQEHEMMIRFKNGSTWQCLGSDGYSGAIGSSPAGIVYSEWSQSNPSSLSYLDPILVENDGWKLFITTPRGKNHAYKTFQTAKKDPDAFAQLITVEDTGIFTQEQLDKAKQGYINLHGEDAGTAVFDQEYYCSFDAAILGAYYGSEFKKIDEDGRICKVPWQKGYKVYTAWDIGRTDDTAIWFYQIVGGELHIIDFHVSSGKDPGYYASQLLGKKVTINIEYGELRVEYGEVIPEIAHRQKYEYGRIGLPHDAKAKTLAAQGKSVQEQLAKVFGWTKTAPTVRNLSFDDGIKASRGALKRAFFDDNERVLEGIEALRQYQREWDDDKKMFKDNHLHNWCSHPADAWRYLGVDWQEEKPKDKAGPLKFPAQGTFNDMLNIVKKRRTGAE